MSGAEDKRSDAALMAGIAAGEQSAYAALVSRHSMRFFRLAYRLTGRHEDAEDVVQDAFVQLWRAPHMWDPTHGSLFTTWFYQVISNRALSLRRQAARHPQEALGDIVDSQCGAEETLNAKHRRLWLESRIRALPERQKLALVLCFYEELSNQDAAEVMGIGIKALQSLLMRAKATLREDINSFDELKAGGQG
ncbi:MAG TPA: sigma-70 family RNA polymerase sigma factor [Alphaproteobacteria bacterium]|nr:sigma-70 family RNA polymerase sigma factor [Alphaproteobacteria bacterium]